MQSDNKADRLSGFILGGLVGDAASQPLHWIYDEEKLATAIQGHEDAPEFLNPSRNPFYSIPTGNFSCYGDQVLVVLESLAENGGKLDISDLSERFFKKFGPGSVYDFADRKNTPINGGWRTFSVTKFCDNYAEGKRLPNQTVGTPDDIQSDCLVRLVPLVAAYAGKEDLLDRAEEVIVLTQTSEVAIAFGLATARIYERFLLASGPINVEQVLRDLIVTLNDPARKKPQVSDAEVVEFLEKSLAQAKENPYSDYQKELGLGCGIKMGFPGSLHLLLKTFSEFDFSSEKKSDAYAQAIRTLIKRGGDTTSRSIFTGALLGAQLGLEHLPKEWTEKTSNFEAAKALIEKLVAAL